MLKATVTIGPKDHGRRMRLADFDHAQVQEGYLYELGRGVIVVSDVPGRRHRRQYHVLRRSLGVYDGANPGLIQAIYGGSECKILVPGFESERHPDLAVYLTPEPPDEATVWSVWVPDIVIEIVSPGSDLRDYEEKREEYHAFGVREYWIIDVYLRQVTVLRRWGRRWRESIVRPPAVYRTRLLPGFELDCAALFAAADADGD
jgi:Uma2 family endonuclease